MRYTLLELVTSILQSLDSDEVNSYSDTTESLAVANIIKENYYRIVANSPSSRFNSIFQLTASGDNTKPCVMYLPSHVLQLETLKYNISDTITDTEYRELDFIPFDRFLQMTDGYNASQESWVDTQVVEVDGADYTFKFRNDVAPSFYTSLADSIILFDAYDSSQSTTLVSSRTLGFGDTQPVFTMSDDFIPALDPREFDYLLNASKSQASLELKQIENTRAARLEKHGKLLAQERNSSIDFRTPLQKRRGYGRC